MIGLRLGGLVVVVGLASLSGAQVLVLTQTTFWVYAEGRAINAFDVDGNSGTITDGSYSDSAAVFVAENDPDLGNHFGAASANLSWTTMAIKDTVTLSGNVGGVAESGSAGLDASATAGATVSLFFSISETAFGQIQSQGTHLSDLFFYDGSGYVPFRRGPVPLGFGGLQLGFGHQLDDERRLVRGYGHAGP